MLQKIITKNPLYFAFLVPALTDGIITLVGQNEQYWNSQMVNEASPAYYFLLVSPWLYILGAGIWFVVWYWIFRQIKEPFNLWLMFLFIAGHSWGSSSWIMKILRDNGFYAVGNQLTIMIAWGILVLYFALIALTASYCLRVYLKTKMEVKE